MPHSQRLDGVHQGWGLADCLPAAATAGASSSTRPKSRLTRCASSHFRKKCRQATMGEWGHATHCACFVVRGLFGSTCAKKCSHEHTHGEPNHLLPNLSLNSVSILTGYKWIIACLSQMKPNSKRMKRCRTLHRAIKPTIVSILPLKMVSLRSF